MYISSTGYFIPENRVDNSYFSKLSGLEENWYVKRTGIHTRSRASDEETFNYICLEAAKKAVEKLPFDVKETDLIILASYTPSDLVGPTPHYVQRELGIKDAKVFHITSACSSSLNAIEVAESFFQSGKATKALVICAERNSSYNDDEDQQNGHLWGDAAVALFLTKERGNSNLQIIDIESEGLGYVGKNIEGVKLNLHLGKLEMPFGKDVFVYACNYIKNKALEILDKNKYTIDDMAYLIGHQANLRIINNVSESLNLPEEKSLFNLHKYGNTGSAGAMLVFAENIEKYKKDDLIVISVFGGGYSAAACLIKVLG